MDSEEIDCILQSDSAVKKKYTKKIYCFDNLPLKMKKNKFYIVNTLSSKNSFKIPGHWCIYLYYSDNKLAFIDPFGVFPPKKFLDPMIRSSDEKTILLYNNVQLQNYSTSTCAQHIIFLSTLFSHNYDLRTIFCKFYHVKNKTDFKFLKYDFIVNSFLMRYYDEYRSIFYDF